jgi:hypothetical protein
VAYDLGQELQFLDLYLFLDFLDFERGFISKSSLKILKTNLHNRNLY